MFEDDVDALLLGQLAHHALETIGAVVDDVIGAERLGLLDLVVGADGGDDGAADLLGQLDRRRADARTAGMNEDRFAGLQLGIVEQHVLDGTEGHRCNSGTDRIDTGRGRNQQAGRKVDLFLREAIEMEAMHAGDMFAEIVAAFAARTAEAAGARAVDRDQLARQDVGYARADRSTTPDASAPITSGILRLAKPCRASPRRRYG
jgi:hypothetical protein